MSVDGRRLALFWAKVDRSGDCWLWTASVGSAGYGSFGIGDGRTTSAHRFAYELHHGPVPRGMFVLHHCDIKRCVNPAHLFAGTHRDNMADAVRKGRIAATKVEGEQSPNAVLSDDQVRQIRERRAAGERRIDLAREYGITDRYVWQLVTHQSRRSA